MKPHPYETYQSQGCKWCALHHNGDRKVTAPLEQSRPNPVHKVYPPHVDGPFSEYLACTAPKSLAEWSRDVADQREALLEALKWWIEQQNADGLITHIGEHGLHECGICQSIAAIDKAEGCA